MNTFIKLFIAVGLAAVLTPGAYAGGKVQVCHVSGKSLKSKLLNLPSKAAQAHARHGDLIGGAQETGQLCSDGIDNDCDGTVDNADPSCAPVVLCPCDFISLATMETLDDIARSSAAYCSSGDVVWDVPDAAVQPFILYEFEARSAPNRCKITVDMKLLQEEVGITDAELGSCRAVLETSQAWRDTCE